MHTILQKFSRKRLTEYLNTPCALLYAGHSVKLINIKKYLLFSATISEHNILFICNDDVDGDSGRGSTNH